MGQLIFIVNSGTTGGGGVTTFEGRSGVVVGVAGDYTSTEITNLSGVAGATVSDALDTLAAVSGGNLQDAYDVGPSGLIVTGAPGPVGVDFIRLENEVISTIDGVAANGHGLEVKAGSAGATTPISPNGGALILESGFGGDAAGGANTAGDGGSIDVIAGSAGQGSGGATQGNGGPINVTAGLGGAGAGGFVSITSGSGVMSSGSIDITAGSSNGTVGTVSITGGLATGVGSGPGGNIEILGGVPAVGQDQDGGVITISSGDGAGGGAGTGTGGDLNLGAGAGGSTGNGGDVRIASGIGVVEGSLFADKGASFGLMARVYQTAINTSGTYVVTHNLNCNAPLVIVYAGTDSVATFAVVQNSLNQITVTAVVGTAGFITVVGI